MAKKAYVGVNDVARKVSKMYVGVNGVARKVKKAYVGVNNIAQQFYEAEAKVNVIISHVYDSMLGQPFKIYKGNTLVASPTFSNQNLPYNWSCQQTGTYTLKTNDDTCAYSFTVNNLNTVTNVDWYATSLRKTFAIATNAELKEMVSAADNTEFSLYDDCAWRVGQEHIVSLSAMSAQYTSETHAAQKIKWALMHSGGYTLRTARPNGTNTATFAIGMVDCLYEKGNMTSSTTKNNVWSVNDRRNWCNYAFPNALPIDFKSIFKWFKVATAYGHPYYTPYTNNEYFTPFSATEVWNEDGTGSYGRCVEGTRFTWYQTSSNRMKIVGNEYFWWWTRSPHKYQDTGYVISNPQGALGSPGSPTDMAGISVYGVI